MKPLLLSLFVLAGLGTTGVVSAQTTTGANTSITLPQPPRAMASLPVAPTPGADATFQGAVNPNLQGTSTVSLPLTAGGTGSPAAAAAASLPVTVQSRPSTSTHGGGSSAVTHVL